MIRMTPKVFIHLGKQFLKFLSNFEPLFLILFDKKIVEIIDLSIGKKKMQFPTIIESIPINLF